MPRCPWFMSIGTMPFCFCSWLSRQEGRGPCYVKNAKEQDHNAREYDARKLVPVKRLPIAHRGGVGIRLSREHNDRFLLRGKRKAAGPLCRVPQERDGRPGRCGTEAL